jgi:hypothetical protein
MMENDIIKKLMESNMKEQTALDWAFIELDELLHFKKKNALEVLTIYGLGKHKEKEQLEKELNRFFLYFRDNGERLLGASIEQLVKSYLKSKYG